MVEDSRVDLFKAVVNGDLEHLQNLPHDTDWNANFTFSAIPCCICAIAFERFVGTPEDMLNCYLEGVTEGRCRHCKGGSGAPTEKGDMVKLSDASLDHPMWDLGYYTSHKTEEDTANLVVGLNPLHVAILLQHRHIIVWLLQKEDINLSSKTGRFKDPPLNLAVFIDNMDIVMMLLNRGADPTIAGESCDDTPALLAVLKNNHDILDLLIKHGADINRMGSLAQFPLCTAVEAEQIKCVEVLLRAGADTKLTLDRDETALLIAIENNSEIAKMLINANAHLNHGGGKSPLVTAMYLGKMDLFTLMLEKNADPNVAIEDDHHIIHIASYLNKPDAVKLLLQYNANVNVLNNTQYSPLHHSAWEGYTEICELLLHAGAKHDGQTKDKNTPLSLACHGNHLPVVQLLLTYGCNVNNKDKDNDTPLLYACFNGNLTLCELLVDNGADPCAVNSAGASTMWNAVYNRKKKVVQFLLEKNVPLVGETRGIDQHAETVDVTYIYDKPRTLLYVALKRKVIGVPTLLQLGGLDVAKEIQSIDFEEFEGDDDITEELNKISHTPLSLKDAARCVVRRITGNRLMEEVDDLGLPYTLGGYLLMKEL